MPDQMVGDTHPFTLSVFRPKTFSPVEKDIRWTSRTACKQP